MATKKYDVAVKTGEYENSAGEKKGRYQNVGAIIQGDNGPYLLLERWFNPAGIVNPDGRSNVILSLFVPQDNNNTQQGANSPAQRQAPANKPSNEFDDDIPF